MYISRSIFRAWSQVTGSRGAGWRHEGLGQGPLLRWVQHKMVGGTMKKNCVNYNDLTATSLEIMISIGNDPQMALIQVSELL